MCVTSFKLWHIYTSRQNLTVKRLTGSAIAGLLDLFISPQIQVLSPVNREAAAAHRPFIVGQISTWARNMPGQDKCCHFYQLPLARVVMLKCVHVSMCMSVTVQVLVNERQTESGEHSREQREGMRKKKMINLVCIE